MKLLTKQGIIKSQTECAPNNGYFLIPLYDKVLMCDVCQNFVTLVCLLGIQLMVSYNISQYKTT